MVGARAARGPWWGVAQRHLGTALLALTTVLVGSGGLLHWAGAAGAGEDVFAATGAVGAAYAGWAVIDSLRRRRLGV
ncbi:MAG TPA: hypothetical protein VE991_10460, partial [Acidimicrobiales bacterium]|nr:hypothetical protein [Acidimicrobiales bacterium]